MMLLLGDGDKLLTISSALLSLGTRNPSTQITDGTNEPSVIQWMNNEKFSFIDEFKLMSLEMV